MRTLAHDRALVEHDDLVCMHDRGDALGHHDERCVLLGACELFAQQGVGLVIERAERVIEDHDLGALCQGACDGEALALAAGDVGSALADF